MIDEARMAYGEACRALTVAQKAYRAREIGDTEFLAARNAFHVALRRLEDAEKLEEVEP